MANVACLGLYGVLSIVRNVSRNTNPLRKDLERDEYKKVKFKSNQEGESIAKKHNVAVWTKRSVGGVLIIGGLGAETLSLLGFTGVLPIGLTGCALLSGSAGILLFSGGTYWLLLGITRKRSNKEAEQVKIQLKKDLIAASNSAKTRNNIEVPQEKRVKIKKNNLAEQKEKPKKDLKTKQAKNPKREAKTEKKSDPAKTTNRKEKPSIVQSYRDMKQAENDLKKLKKSIKKDKKKRKQELKTISEQHTVDMAVLNEQIAAEKASIKKVKEARKIKETLWQQELEKRRIKRQEKLELLKKKIGGEVDKQGHLSG